MNNTRIKTILISYFMNGGLEFKSFLDLKKKKITAVITHPDVNVVKTVTVNIFPTANYILFEIAAKDLLIGTIKDTYNNELGMAFTKWFKPFLRNIVNDKYCLKGDIITDELSGTDYCQMRDDGLLLFTNLSEMMEFTML